MRCSWQGLCDCWCRLQSLHAHLYAYGLFGHSSACMLTFFLLTLYLTGREKSPLLRRNRDRGAPGRPAVRVSGTEDRLVNFSGDALSGVPSTTTKPLPFPSEAGAEVRLLGFDGGAATGLNVGSFRGGLVRPDSAVMLPRTSVECQTSIYWLTLSAGAPVTCGGIHLCTCTQTYMYRLFPSRGAPDLCVPHFGCCCDGVGWEGGTPKMVSALLLVYRSIPWLCM